MRVACTRKMFVVNTVIYEHVSLFSGQSHIYYLINYWSKQAFAEVFSLPDCARDIQISV